MKLLLTVSQLEVKNEIFVTDVPVVQNISAECLGFHNIVFK